MSERVVTSFSWPQGKVDRARRLPATSSGCPLRVLRQVSDLVLIDPFPEDAFEDDQWKEYW